MNLLNTPTVERVEQSATLSLRKLGLCLKPSKFETIANRHCDLHQQFSIYCTRALYLMRAVVPGSFSFFFHFLSHIRRAKFNIVESQTIA